MHDDRAMKTAPQRWAQRDARRAGAAGRPDTAQAISEALKAHYDELLNAPLPERFNELLAQLESKERKHD